MIKPWVAGPKELLEHGLEHFRNGTDFDCRIAIISIDNSVELMIKTYLGLPKRETGITGLKRQELDEASNSLPTLLDLLEKFATDKTIDLDLSDIEWFHRLRNQLYHSGNGITVEKSKVEIYAEIARTLFSNLFGFPIETNGFKEPFTETGEFLHKWSEVTQELREIIAEKDGGDRDISKGFVYYRKIEILEELSEDPKWSDLYSELSNFRNYLAHGFSTFSSEEIKTRTRQTESLLQFLKLKRN